MTRIVSALVLGGLTVYLIVAAPLLVGALAVLGIALVAAHECAGLLETAGSAFPRTPALVSIFLMIGGAWGGGIQGLSAGLAAGLTLTFAWATLSGEVSGSVMRMAGGASLLLYPVWALAHVVFYLNSGPGRRALLFLLLCVWVCDSAAYYVGSAAGKKKLAPEISPNKTVAGSVGGVAGAVAASIILTALGLVGWSIPFALGAGLCISVLAQAGDLVESMIKRDAGVKDSGSLIPGHGGILDRIDALLFTVPVFFYILFFYGGLL